MVFECNQINDVWKMQNIYTTVWCQYYCDFKMFHLYNSLKTTFIIWRHVWE